LFHKALFYHSLLVFSDQNSDQTYCFVSVFFYFLADRTNGHTFATVFALWLNNASYQKTV